LREIRDISIVNRQLENQAKTKTPAESITRTFATEGPIEPTLGDSEKAVFIGDNDYQSNYGSETNKDDLASNVDDRDTGGKLTPQMNKKKTPLMSIPQSGSLDKVSELIMQPLSKSCSNSWTVNVSHRL
jgi:hypothetical protein